MNTEQMNRLGQGRMEIWTRIQNIGEKSVNISVEKSKERSVEKSKEKSIKKSVKI